ncbi:RagB/SusD family nutrient uptake outer membrane protein [Marinoscillum sp. MHG1-6]|uniref:RagB/SusD family nutrient uptake outer membrane protein n=1 Tax=Marinoscillum sp. MHG1-6 TaxID=2959627 RepID=UPI0021573AC4|nr:RagB/SusD family nutrient uptake outer membrane protein [Marinoscillum sp. MHG1-6]
MKLYKYLLVLPLIAQLSCTDLDEELKSDATAEEAQAYLIANADYDALLEVVYRDFDGSMVNYENGVNVMNIISSDEGICPSRPSGWDNGGEYRTLHQHTWTAAHPINNSVWGKLNRGNFDATNILSFDPPVEVAAEARFLRAFFLWQILDLWGQVPFRNPGEDLREAPLVLSRQEAIDFIISEVEEVLPDLSTTNPAYRATQNAARALLAKLYINRGVYINRESPTFLDSDMDKVISYVDAIDGKALDFYWDSFGPDNNDISSEIIFSIESIGGGRVSSLWTTWYAILPGEIGGGWNGWATIAEFYNSFEEADIRRYYEHPITIEGGGYNVGFVTQRYLDAYPQYDSDDNLKEQIIFSKEISVIQNAGLYDGYRPIKYVPDYDNGWSNADNDYVLFRYADMLLLKAEALLRKGDAASALTIVNEIRTDRQVAELGTLDLEGLLAERGRELFWEGYRRNDQIRYGTFLESWTLKEPSDPMYLLFPIPKADVMANPNLEQNPGY